MAMVQRGGDRQEVHEQIRVHSVAAAKVVKEEGRANDMLERIREDLFFAPIHDILGTLLNPQSFVGRAPEQVQSFLQAELWPVVAGYSSVGSTELGV